MKLDLLRDWLKLPPGPWPPDHFTLLGLPRGGGDIDQVEQSALERMELLRRYQIRHPEEVTEGMNRLARAMICLTDPAARRDYAQALGLPVPEPEPLPDPGPPEPAAGETAETPAAAAETAEEAPLVLDLAEAGPAGQPPAPAPLPDLPGEQLILDLPPPAEVIFSAEGELRRRRRELYARLARVRRVLRLWEQLRPHLADPEEPLARRSEAVAMAATLAELQPLVPGSPSAIVEGVGGPGQPGHLVAALSRQPLVIETFRGLLPSQRQALAQDWEAGREELHRQRRELRDEVQSLLPRDWRRRVLVPLGRSLARTPEWGLLAVGLCALLIALVRGW